MNIKLMARFDKNCKITITDLAGNEIDGLIALELKRSLDSATTATLTVTLYDEDGNIQVS